MIDDDAGPWSQLRTWIDEGGAVRGGTDMVLATADAEGVPSARVVSLRGLDDRGLRFYTHDGLSLIHISEPTRPY